MPAFCLPSRRIDLVAEAGATFIYRISVLDGDGNPIDWTAPASTATLHVRDAPGGDLVLALTEGAGLILGATGEIDIRVEASEAWTVDGSTLVDWAVYRYDLLVTQDGDTWRIAEGRIGVRPTITTPPP